MEQAKKHLMGQVEMLERRADEIGEIVARARQRAEEHRLEVEAMEAEVNDARSTARQLREIAEKL
ncbi:hypothetical protein [Burkholderia gladioli]|uniref:hypothetical protein n=1 Tax=Burkholderia gladioli TaxID=28095 RepID=UPI000F52CD47|nr:hypothetical protein [Burkholderia gladioli]